MVRLGLDWPGLGLGLIVGAREYGNELPGSIKWGEIIDKLRNC